MMRKTVANISVLAVSVLLSLAVVEAAARVVWGEDVLTTRNWITSRSHLLNVFSVNVYDPVVGWRLKDDLRSGGFNTGEHGLRFTRSEPNPQTAKVLAVGDSFTAGSEVVDQQSWPAHLEKMLGTQVLNGGVGAYGTDQIVLRGEQLLEHTDPEILIVGFLENDISRSEYEVYGGGPKAYFTIENGDLVANNIPVPRNLSADASEHYMVRSFGYSLVATRLIERMNPELFLSFQGPVYRRVPTDPVRVTCLLLERLAEKAKARDIRLIHLMQFGGGLISTTDEPPVGSRAVMQCAHNAGYQVVDEFAALRAVYDKDPEDLKNYYVMADNGRVYGHMSSQGNQLVAGLVKLAIDNPGMSISDENFENEISMLRDAVESDGVNFLDLEVFQSGLINVDMEITDAQGDFGTVYKLTAKGEDTEHYLNTGVFPSSVGAHVASVYVNPGRERLIRFQLLDSKTVGLIADFDLDAQTVQLNRRTVGHADAWIEELPNNWYRIGVSADLENDKVYSILQFTKTGTTSFSADEESFEFSGFRLERGDKPAK